MLKTVVLLNSFVEIVIHLQKVIQKWHIFKVEILCNIINVFTVTFYQFNVRDKLISFNFFFFFINLKLLNNSIYITPTLNKVIFY